MTLLEVTDIHSYYGHIHALKGVTLTVEQGEIVALLGSNGAGKTTTLKTISGLIKPRQGDVSFSGKCLKGLSPHEIVSLGIVQIPEGRKIFGSLTVEENLELGAFSLRNKRATAEGIETVFAMFPVLKERRRQPAGTLSGGEQQMLAIGRGLMARPRLLMLDEPSMGLAPLLVEAIMAMILEINRRGTTILLVEQNARAALRLATRGYVIETGVIVLEDRAEALLSDDRVIKAYLGG